MSWLRPLLLVSNHLRRLRPFGQKQGIELRWELQMKIQGLGVVVTTAQLDSSGKIVSNWPLEGSLNLLGLLCLGVSQPLLCTVLRWTGQIVFGNLLLILSHRLKLILLQRKQQLKDPLLLARMKDLFSLNLGKFISIMTACALYTTVTHYFFLFVFSLIKRVQNIYMIL